MNLKCWCESGLSFDLCHGSYGCWHLPAIEGITIQLKSEIPVENLQNMCSYFEERFEGIRLSPQNNKILLSSNEVYWDFIDQVIWVYPNIPHLNNLRVPSIYKSWAGIPDDLSSQFIEKQFEQLTDITDVDSLENFFKFKQGVNYILFASNINNIVTNFKKIYKLFPKIFKNAYVDFLTIKQHSQVLPILIRSQTKNQILGFERTVSLLNSKWKDQVPENLAVFSIDILHTLFGEQMTGFSAPWVDRCISITFGERYNFDKAQYVSSYVRGAHNDFYPEGIKTSNNFNLTLQEFRIFTGWYIFTINKFLTYIYHPFSFTDYEKRTISPSIHLKKILTLEQLFKLTLRIIGSDDRYIKKILTIQFLDIIANTKNGNNNNLNELFKTNFTNELFCVLEKLPISIRKRYISFAKKTWKELEDEIVNNIIEDFNKEQYITLPSGNKVPRNEYIGQYVRQIRNVTHGYSNTKNNIYEEYLFINSGEIPSKLPNIVPILFLCLVIKPDLFFKSNIFTNSFD